MQNETAQNHRLHLEVASRGAGIRVSPSEAAIIESMIKLSKC